MSSPECQLVPEHRHPTFLDLVEYDGALYALNDEADDE